MDQQFLNHARERLAGRTKRQLIWDMIVRAPHPDAKEKVVLALESYPLFLLSLAHDYPTKIWILDQGETPTSADILSEHARSKRWHSRGVGLDKCEGVVDVADDFVAMVVSWKRMLIIRHEFAHVATTFFSRETSHGLKALYERASARGRFVETLASESLGEYVACGMSYYFFDDLREELRWADADLHDLLAGILDEAEEISARMAATGGVAGPRA